MPNDSMPEVKALAFTLDIPRLKAGYWLGARPFTKFKLLEAALEEFDRDGGKALVDNKALYDRILSDPEGFKLSSFEFLSAFDVIFLGIGKSRPPLFEKTNAARRLGELIEGCGDFSHAKRFFSRFFEIWPTGPGFMQAFRDEARHLFEAFKSYYPPQAGAIDFFKDSAPRLVAKACSASESFPKFCARTGLVDAPDNAAFYQAVWEARFEHYRQAFLRSAGTRIKDPEISGGELTDQEEALFSVMTEETCWGLDSKELPFKYGNASEDSVLRFFESITSEYGINARIYASEAQFPEAVVERLGLFLVKAFPEDTPGWPRVKAEIKKLLNFWKAGDDLILAFSFADWLVGLLDDDRHMWEPRLKFWKAYWRAGRLRKVTIFMKNSDATWGHYKQRFEQQFGKKFRFLVCPVSGSLNANLCMAFAIDEDLYVVDGDKNFALRIGTAQEADGGLFGSWRLSETRSGMNPTADDLRKWTEQSFTHDHRGYWKRDANRCIQALSGIQSPEGAG